MLQAAGGWVELGADEQKPAKEAASSLGQSPGNPSVLVRAQEGSARALCRLPAALMEALGLCELEHHPKNKSNACQMKVPGRSADIAMRTLRYHLQCTCA